MRLPCSKVFPKAGYSLSGHSDCVGARLSLPGHSDCVGARLSLSGHSDCVGARLSLSGHSDCVGWGVPLCNDTLRQLHGFHQFLDVGGPFADAGGGGVGFAHQWVGQAGGDEGRLVWGEFAGPGVKEAFGSSFGAVNAASHFGHI